MFSILLLTVLGSCEMKPETLMVTDVGPYWLSNQPLVFNTRISDTASFDLYLHLRNRSDYPWARFFATWVVKDSSGHVVDSLLAEALLFDPVTGQPKGRSGIGDIFEHEVPVRKGIRFPYSGRFSVTVSQMMRTDSLAGIVSVGLRIEPSGASPVSK